MPDPGNAEALRSKHMAPFSLGRHGEAPERLDATCRLFPEDMRGPGGRGFAPNHTGRRAEAPERRPGDESVQIGRSKALSGLGMCEEAPECINSIPRADEGEITPPEKAELLWKLGRDDKAGECDAKARAIEMEYEPGLEDD